jgi:DNA-binding NarL/FixJ family response regulator
MAAVKQTRTRVILVDDQPMMRRGLADLINGERDLVVCGEAGDAQGGLDLIPTAKPDLAIIDISLSNWNGIELIKEIHGRYPQVLILVLTTHDEEIYAERSLRAGASGYVMKDKTAATMMSAIRRVLSGHIYTSDKLNDRLMHQFARSHQFGGSNTASDTSQLSNREVQIFRLLGDGVRAREIAKQLYLSVRTIESHRVNIKQKLGIKTSAELLRYAIKFWRTER